VAKPVTPRRSPVEPPDADGARHLDGQLLSDLWVFRTAARFGSFTAAAKRIGVTQGAVSQRVQRLEARLGRRMFTRKKSRIALTDDGAAFLAAMNQVAMVLGEPLSRLERGSRRALVVSCVPSFATEWLVPNLSAFYAENPDIELFVRAELVAMSVERMEDHGIDVAIQYELEPIADLYELLAHRELTFPVCSAAYRQRLQDSGPADWKIVRLHDEEPWHGAARNAEWQTLLAGAEAGWKASPAAERHFNLAHLAYHAAMGDQGVAIGRAVIVHRLLSKGDLVFAQAMAPAPSAYYRVVTGHPGDTRSAVRRFAAWLGKALATTQADVEHLLKTS